MLRAISRTRITRGHSALPLVGPTKNAKRFLAIFVCIGFFPLFAQAQPKDLDGNIRKCAAYFLLKAGELSDANKKETTFYQAAIELWRDFVNLANQRGAARRKTESDVKEEIIDEFAKLKVEQSYRDRQARWGEGPNFHAIYSQRCAATYARVTFMTDGVEALRKRDHDEAIKILSEVIKVDPSNAAAYFSRGFAYAEKGQSQRAMADFRRSIVGKWRGDYDCVQGKSGLTVDVKNDSAGQLTGEFRFFALPENRAVPEGAYELTVDVQLSGHKYVFRPRKWLQRPGDYVMVGFSGSMDPTNGDAFRGRINHEGCGNVQLRRDYE